MQLVKGLNEYFDSDGYLAHEVFERDVEKLVQRFEAAMEKTNANPAAEPETADSKDKNKAE